jgi:hypothetical protein
MAHTDKDHERYVDKHHPWLSSHDPKWDKGCCRQERARAAHVMRRACAGHVDWDELTFDSHRLSVW